MEISRPAPTRDETPTSAPAVASPAPDLRAGINTAAVLALQRTAGNRSVVRLLGRQRALARQDHDGARAAASPRAGVLDVTGRYGERTRGWSAERRAWSVELNQAGE